MISVFEYSAQKMKFPADLVTFTEEVKHCKLEISFHGIVFKIFHKVVMFF